MNNRIHWAAFVVLSLFSPALLALGLGGAVVESYLGQPLDVKLELISQSDEELQSITAGLASAEDFEMLGLSRTAITVPMEFELVTDTARPYVHITSSLTVNEPVVQVLVEVVWSSGRMLREYTLFLDPPTVDSAAPPVVVKPAPVKTPPLESTAPTVTPIQKTVKPAVESIVAPEVAEDTADRPAEPSDDVTGAEPATEQVKKQEPQQEREQETGQFSEDEVYGPVARGETLWGIAREYSRGSGYSINQAMLALQRKNPEAFIKGNINSLKSGAILRLPAISELGELDSREAMLEVLRQEEEKRTGIRVAAPDFSTPTVADSGDYQATVTEVAPEPETDVDEGHLELVPPAEEEQLEPLASEQVGGQDVIVETLQEELSRTEEELVNARQENTYLAERIKELEAQALAREEQAGTVRDSDLANMESSLAEQRADDQAEPPLAITPGGEKQAWYAGKTFLIAGLGVVLIALIIWGLRRRSAGLPGLQPSPEIRTTADATADAPPAPDSSEDEGETVVQPIAEPGLSQEPEPEPEPEPEEPTQILEAVTDEEPTVVLRQHDVEAESQAEPYADFDEDDDVQEGEYQDEDDPEIKLDLARAYLSLGDKEASKSMLDEVMRSGSDAQKAEARQMLDEL